MPCIATAKIKDLPNVPHMIFHITEFRLFFAGPKSPWQHSSSPPTQVEGVAFSTWQK
jgi:hypothetical protein